MTSFTGLLPFDPSFLDDVRASCRAAIETTAGADLPDLLTTIALAAETQPLLALSGGLDSSLLACTWRDRWDETSLVVLSTVDARRDRASAEAAACALGLPSSLICPDAASILAAIERHRAIVRPLPDYTHRILAVCEIHLCEHAAAAGRLLVTGHGPEALLGGFHRRAVPSLDEPERILDALMANIARLNSVALSTGARVLAPFWNPRVISALAALRREGAGHETLFRHLPPGFPRPEAKSSLQNGSGVHYLFERMAEERGFERTRDYMESLLA